VDALNLLGLIYHREQRYEESVHTFQKALEFDARCVKTLNNLAASYAAESRSSIDSIGRVVGIFAPCSEKACCSPNSASIPR
jgi:tetratricopeptide (TPR) repeat protein